MAAPQSDFEAEEEFEALLGGDVDWVDDVTEYKCVRCARVLVQHYIANCDHKFCANCKRVVDDGSQRWKCPKCKEFIKNMDRQDVDFRDKVKELMLHCPNRKYGCQRTCVLKDLKEHMRECVDTKERALPVLYKGNIPQEMLEQMLKVNESVAELRQKMMESERKREEDKAEVEMTLRNMNIRLDGAYSDLHVQTNRLSDEIRDLKSSWLDGNASLVVEENKAKILKLESKSELWVEMLDKKVKNLTELINKTKLDLKSDLQILKFQTENKVEGSSEMGNYSEKFDSLELKVAKEVTSMKVEIEFKIENLATKEMLDSKEYLINQRFSNLKRYLQNQQTNYSSSNVKTETEILKQNAEIEELSEKMKLMAKAAEEIDQSVATMNWVLNEQTAQLSQLKLNEFKQKLFQLETSILQIKPQLTCFDLCEERVNFHPDFTWKISGIDELIEQVTFHVKSEVFSWNGYPVKAQAQLELKQDDDVYVSLNLKDHNIGKALVDFKHIPNVYYVLRDQTNNAETKHRTRSMSYLFKSTFSYSHNNYELPFAFKLKFLNRLYHVDDCVVIEIYIEPPSLTQQVHSYDGALHWSVDNYRKRKQMEKEGLVTCQESPCFCTSSRGFRVRVDVYLNGWGERKRKGLSVLISFLSGEFDASIRKSFRHQTTVTLLDRKCPEKSVSQRVFQSVEDKLPAFYYVDVCGEEEVECLLESDTLFYNVVIKSVD